MGDAGRRRGFWVVLVVEGGRGGILGCGGGGEGNVRRWIGLGGLGVLGDV